MKLIGLASAATIAAVAAMAVGAPAAELAAEPGRLFGYVRDSRGLPVPGALISVFGKGLGGGLVTFSDNAGRVIVPRVPAGAYTLRALARGDRASTVETVTVLPNQDSVFALSLRAILADPDALAEDEASSEPARRVRWLVRHKPRSILESEDEDVPEARDLDRVEAASGGILSQALPWLPEMQGSVEWATPVEVGSQVPESEPSTTNLGALRLRGRLGDAAEWSLGGLVAERESASWRMAAEFVVEPGGGHRLEAGAGYGDNVLRNGIAAGTPTDDGSTGAVFVVDRFDRGPFVATVGARYTYISFLADDNHISPQASLTARTGKHTRVRVGYTTQAVTPGGDLLALSTLSVAPAAAEIHADASLRAERVGHLELAGIRSFGRFEVTGFGFSEHVHDQLVNRYEGGGRGRLHVTNGPGASCQGLGVTLERRFGGFAGGSITYSYGRQRGVDGRSEVRSRFHDVVARLETAIDATDTRLSGVYRVNALGAAGEPSGRAVTTRFDVQLSQGLPFLGNLTRAQWDLLVAFRNLLYETSEGAFLDEVVVKNPPKRVVGGVSVRF